MKLSPNDDDRIWKESKSEGWYRFPSPVHFAILVVVLALLAIGLWFLLSPLRQTYETSEIPLIEADTTAFKVRAEDQGVPSVKHQDKLVYERISGETKEPAIEHILPDPELPLEQIKETQPIQMIEQLVSESEEKEPDPSLSSIEALIGTMPEEDPVPDSKPKTGTIYIQLGSLKSYDLAEAEWNRISKKHKDTLGNFDPLIQKVDLGESQGIYYRLRTGPFENREMGTKVCETLREKKSECIVIP